MSTATKGRTDTATPGTTSPGLLLGVILTATFMGQFDFFVVNVAAPSLERDLHAGDAALQLIIGGYAFAYAAGLITGGRLGDIFGNRRLFLGGMAGFTVASLLCGLATSPGQLIAARLLQGATAALLLPQVLALITTLYPAASRGRALAWYGVAAGLGSIAGQIAGGALVSADVAGLGWRLIFLVNLPVGAAALAAGWRVLPRPATLGRTKLDPVGALGAAATLALLLAPITLGREQGWPLWTWLSMLGAAVVAVATGRWLIRLADRGGMPILDPSLLAKPAFRAGLLANAAFMLYFASYMFTLTLLLQPGMGLSPQRAGLAFVPAGVAYSVSALSGRKLAERYGQRVILAGCLITTVGLVLLAYRMSGPGADDAVTAVVVIAALISFGNGLVLPALIGAALTDVEPARAGMASGVLNTCQQFAGATGVAVMGTLYFAMARDTGGSHGFVAAMPWVASIFVVLILAVAALLFLLRRAATAR